MSDAQRTARGRHTLSAVQGRPSPSSYWLWLLRLLSVSSCLLPSPPPAASRGPPRALQLPVRVLEALPYQAGLVLSQVAQVLPHLGHAKPQRWTGMQAPAGTG